MSPKAAQIPGEPEPIIGTGNQGPGLVAIDLRVRPVDVLRVSGSLRNLIVKAHPTQPGDLS